MGTKIVWGAILALLVATGSVTSFAVAPSQGEGSVLEANIDIRPSTLNLRSMGLWISALIELPEGYNASDIDLSTVLLEGAIPAVTDGKYGFVHDLGSRVSDRDRDGIEELMVKFRRADLVQYLEGLGLSNGEDVTLKVSGEINGEVFEGNDTIRVVLGRYPKPRDAMERLQAARDRVKDALERMREAREKATEKAREALEKLGRGAPWAPWNATEKARAVLEKRQQGMLGRGAPWAPWSYVLSFDDKVLDKGGQVEWLDAAAPGSKEEAFQYVFKLSYTMDARNYRQLEYFAKASETMSKGSGDCEDKAILYASTLLTLGEQPKVVFGDTKVGPGHAWVESGDYVYDPTAGIYEMPKEAYYQAYVRYITMWFDATTHWHLWND